MLYIRHCENLFQSAKTIFGDSVVDAFVGVGEFYGPDELKVAVSGFSDPYLFGGIIMKAEDIVIEFENKRFVRFESSGWTGISLYDKKEMIIK